jgi:hypothetical protein
MACLKSGCSNNFMACAPSKSTRESGSRFATADYVEAGFGSGIRVSESYSGKAYMPAGISEQALVSLECKEGCENTEVSTLNDLARPPSARSA